MLPSGQVTYISQLPSSMPAYLIHVIPELKMNGSVVLSGDAMTLGQDLTFVFTPQFAGRQSIQKTYSVAAGSYLDVAVVAGNVSSQMLTNVQARVQQTAAILQTQDPTQIGNLTQENLLGDMFQAGVLGYYAQYIALSHVMGQQQHDFHYLAAGIGSFGYEPHVDYTFGIPKAIRGGGAVMNVPIVSVTSADSQDAGKLTNYRLQIGTLSSELEAGVPEQLFSDPTQPTQAVSAVTALALANQQDQRIYQITPANEAATLPNIHHNGLVMQEIRDALAAGKDVITHTNDISVSGWTGAGYIIVDPVTGDGAYKIGGGSNGGFISIIPDWAKELSWAIFGELAGKIGKVLSGLNDVYNQIISFIDIIKNCPTGQAIAAIISITFLTVGLLLLVPAFAALGVIAAIVYAFFSAIRVGALAAGWEKSCKPK